MNTFEIITLSEIFNKINNGEEAKLSYDIKDGQFKVEAIKDHEYKGYWGVYVYQWLPKQEKWATDYVCTKRHFSMSGEIADAIDKIKEHIEI